MHQGEQLVVFVRSHRPGDTVTLTVKRGGERLAVQVRLGGSDDG